MSKQAKVAAPKASKAKAAPIQQPRNPTGVAQGAATQPHTKQAIKQARAREATEAKAAGMVPAIDIASNPIWVDPRDPLVVKNAKGYVLFPNATHAEEARRMMQAAKAAPPKQAKTAKVKAEKAPRAAKVTEDRAYTKGATKDASRAGSWRNHMLTVIMANKSVAAATAAHAASKQFPTNKLDFRWAAAQGYIVWK